MSQGTYPAGAVHRSVVHCTDLTAAMLRAAAGSDWPRVAELEDERRACAAGIRLDMLSPIDVDAVRVELKKLVAMDGRLVALVVEARGRALSALRIARGQAKATAAYHSAGR